MLENTFYESAFPSSLPEFSNISSLDGALGGSALDWSLYRISS